MGQWQARAAQLVQGGTAVCTPPTTEGNDLTTYLPAGDEFGDLRARLACGCLRGYGQLGLPNGAVVLNVEGYVRTRLADLEWPQLAPVAARHLRLLQEALAGLDALGDEKVLSARLTDGVEQ